MNPSIILVVVMLLFLVVIMVGETPAFAMSKYINCMTEIANSHHSLTIADVNGCYKKEFHRLFPIS